MTVRGREEEGELKQPARADGCNCGQMHYDSFD